jgi:hypothetical protein
MYSAPGIFNAADDWGGIDGGMSSGKSNVQNQSALQAAIDAAQASANPCGAIVLIPSIDQLGSPPTFDAYPIGSSSATGPVITIPASGYPDSPLLICGTGNGTTLSMQTNGATGDTVLFSVSDTANVTFQDLTVTFANGVSPHWGVAFSFSGGARHTLFRVNIEQCQYPVVIKYTDGIALRHCDISYDRFTSSISDVTAISIVGASQASIADCLIRYDANQDPSGYYGIAIAQSSFTKLRDNQITGFGHGVKIGDGTDIATVGTTFGGVRVSIAGNDPGPAVTVTSTVFDLSFVNCHFQAPDPYASDGSGIQIGLSGDDNGSIDTVRFASCTLVGGYTATSAFGMQISAGQNIQVTGGKFSGCGATAGIAIAGATEVQIIGTSCIGPEYGYENGNYPGPRYQQVGVAISAGQNIQLINVNCSGSGTPTEVGYGVYMAPSEGATIADVRVVGVICTNPVLEEPISSTVVQECGIYAEQVSNLLILGCSLSGNNANAIYLQDVNEVIIASCDLYGNEQGIYVGNACASLYIRDNNITGYNNLEEAITFASSSALVGVEVTNCAGYNDVHPVLFGPSLAPSAVFSAVSLGGYYGPSAFYLWGGSSSVKVNGYATNLTSGNFVLFPGESAQVGGGIVPGTLLMIGT